MKIIIDRPCSPFAYVYERVAKKSYTCACCNASINPGDIYFDKNGIKSNHRFYNLKYCTPCYDTKNI